MRRLGTATQRHVGNEPPPFGGTLAIRKRQRTGAVQNLAETPGVHEFRVSVLECASPLALSRYGVSSPRLLQIFGIPISCRFWTGSKAEAARSRKRRRKRKRRIGMVLQRRGQRECVEPRR